ncbi:hypothetical protein ACIRST_23485 [Kitasatospora sp. NPDC101447]|uniref:hypothetical protein n=1 Tax=Kitasatospora sp. NPDC101447 TaxID=3364102 RepID=UPI003803B17A
MDGIPPERMVTDSWPALHGRPVLRRTVAVGLVLCVSVGAALVVRGVNALTLGSPGHETDRDRAERLAGLHPSQHPGVGRYYVPVGAVYTHTSDGAPIAYLHYRLGGGKAPGLGDFLSAYDLPAPGPAAPLPPDLVAALGGDEPAEAPELPEGPVTPPSPTSSPSALPSSATSPVTPPSPVPSPSVPPPPVPSPSVSPEAEASPSPSPSRSCSHSSHSHSSHSHSSHSSPSGPSDPPSSAAPAPTGDATALAPEADSEADPDVDPDAGPDAEVTPTPEVTPAPDGEPAVITPTPAATVTPTPTATPTRTSATRRIYVSAIPGGLSGAADIYIRATG